MYISYRRHTSSSGQIILIATCSGEQTIRSKFNICVLRCDLVEKNVGEKIDQSFLVIS